MANVRLNSRGIRELLKSAEVRALVAGAANTVAATVAAHHSVVRHTMPVGRGQYESDRAVESVTIEHPGGIAADAKYGILLAAADAAGLDTTEYTE